MNSNDKSIPKTKPPANGETRHYSIKKNTPVVLFLCFLIGITLSIAGAWYIYNYQQQKIIAEFKIEADRRALIFKEEIDLNLEDLYALKAFFDATGSPGREQFQVMADEQLQRHPDIRALEWIPRIPDNSRAAMESLASEEGIANFKITERDAQQQLVPAAARPEYFPVYYVEPMPGNEVALGFDLASDETRRESLEQARDSGNPRATARVKLVQEKGSRYGFLVFLPVYSGQPGNVSERRQQLKGFVLGVYIVNEIYEKALTTRTKNHADIAITIRDDSAPVEKSILYESAPDSEVITALEYRKRLGDVSGRQWSLTAAPTTNYLQTKKSYHPFIVFLGGLFVTLLLTNYIWNILKQAAGATDALAQSKESIITEKSRLKAVIDNVIDGIITIDERGSIETFNPAARLIFGYSDTEVIGQNVKMLMPEPYHSAHDGYLDHHIKTGEKKVIGIGREVVGRRKDGSTFPMDLAVSQVIIDNARHFVGITRDITERKRIEQMQQEFISTVSHELRTPLTSIRGSLGLILGGVAGELPEKAQALLTIANNNSERLIHLINDILDIEKIAAGKMQFDYTVTNLIPVIQQAVESNKGYADQLHVRFKLNSGADDEVMVRIDVKRMAQVMSNLLSNAAKYSPTNDRVEIAVKAAKDRVRISVHDHGKGIPEEFKSRIFNKFAQADSSDTRQKGGTGLGLNITKIIVEQQGGSIGFDSGEGKGTTFYVDLPLWHEERKVEKASEEKRSDQPLLLIIEDDEDVSNLLSMMLEKEGCRFHQAFNYQEAMQQIQTHQYSAITLDLMIPGGSGLALLRELRENEATRELPVIVVSAKANEGQLEVEGATFSMVDWIEKPIDENKLLESIRSGVSHAAANGGRILHVEDDPDIAVIVDSLLGNECQVVHAVTLQQARQYVREKAFDLVLLDIGLPDGSGLELLPMLNSPEYQTPVIIFSAQDVGPDIAAQVKGTLVKSKTDNEKLILQIKAVINKKT